VRRDDLRAGQRAPAYRRPRRAALRSVLALAASAIASRRGGCATTSERIPGAATMNINLSLAPVVSLIAGILILVVPRLLNYIVAIYLIVIGLIGLFGTGNLHLN
jgi:hypothetical protein